jgi:hypothetical protein
MSGQEGSTAALLAHGGKVDYENRSGKTALMVAAAEGNVALVNLLLDRGAQVEYVTTHGATVGRCTWTASNKPVLKAPTVSALETLIS